jgi:hypothetical protein
MKTKVDLVGGLVPSSSILIFRSKEYMVCRRIRPNLPNKFSDLQ